MTENPFDMFVIPEDYTSWDRYDQQIDKIELRSMERQRIRSGLRYFRSLMGEDFLKETIQTGHPFISMITNAAPRERVYLAELAEHLQAFETVENFISLRNRIISRDPDTFAEGLSVLEIAQHFRSAGFLVSFEPRVLVTQKSGEKRPKFPDVKIRNEGTSEEVFVEVSRLLVGEAQRKSRRTFQALFNIWDGLTWRYRTISSDDPFGKAIMPNIKFHRSMTNQELEIIANALNELGSLVLSTNNFAELSIANTVEAGIAPPFDHEAVHEWARRRNLKHPPVEGPPIQTDEVERAIRKIFDDDDKTAKKWQLPDDGPGIVVLETNKNLILFTHSVGYMISALEQSMLNEPKLNYIILTLSFTSVEAAGKVLKGFGNHTIVRNSNADGSIEYAVMIQNGACKTPLSNLTAEKLVGVFGLSTQ